MIDQPIIRSYESLEIEEVNTVRHWDETEKREMIKESQKIIVNIQYFGGRGAESGFDWLGHEAKKRSAC